MPQSLAKLYIHLIFSTKNRTAILMEAWREELFSVLGGTTNNIGCHSLIVGGVEDHVHLLFQLSRTLSISEATGLIKSNSSSWVNEERKLSREFHWQAGYAAFSVSQSNVEAVRDYIFHQPEHHKKISFQEEMRDFFRKYEVAWDERYVWD